MLEALMRLRATLRQILVLLLSGHPHLLRRPNPVTRFPRALILPWTETAHERFYSVPVQSRRWYRLKL